MGGNTNNPQLQNASVLSAVGVIPSAGTADWKLHHQSLINYLQRKIALNDWHAVRDVAVDIEILEAKNGRI